ncbi:TPA: hypothetical protein EYP27_04385, partial [Candidatus Bathyarchaeota archaeon]|nr:hypothetical protein [Candidatus Bathyarchaeota archaeon]
AWIDSTRARNLEEFREAASKIAYSTNWFYADVEGNIAYFYTGVYPARPEGIDLRLPTPGTGEYEWKAFLPFQANPQDVKKEGYFVQWNNRPAKGWVNNERMFTWGVADRVEILDRMVKALDKISIEDLKEINRKASFMDPNALYLKPLLLEAYDMVRPEDPQIMEAIGYIREWDGLRIDRDGDGLYDSVGQTVFEKWVEILLQNVFADEFGPFSRIVTFKYPEGPYGRSFRPATPGASMLLHAWEGSEATVPPAIDYFNGKDPYDVALAALKKALEELREKYGDRMEEWKREVNIFKFTSKNFARITQSYAEVRDTIYMNRGTENHLVELDAERVKGLIVVPPGQSGFININGVRALHYDDQLDLYENFQYKPTLLYEEDVLMNAELNIALVYPPLMSAKEVASNLKRLAERLEAADAQALKKLEELSQAHGETAEEVGRLASSQEEAAKSLSRLEGEVGGLASKQEELAKSLSQLAAGQREASKAVSELKDMLDKLASEQEKLSGKLEEVAWLAGALQLLAYSAIALAIIAIILSALRSVSRRGLVKAGPAA